MTSSSACPLQKFPCKTRFLCRPKQSQNNGTNYIRNAFFHDFRFFWIILKLIGLFPYKLNKDGEITFQWLSKEMFMSILIYSITSVPVLMVLCLRYSQHIEFSGNFDREIHLYMMSLIMMPQLSVPLTHWLELPRFQKTFKKWREFQERYEDVLNKKLTLHVNWSNMIYIIAGFSFAFFMILIHFYFRFSKYPWEMFANIYMLLFVLLHKLLLVGLVRRLTFIARNIRTEVIQTMTEENPEQLAKMAGLWISLSEVVNLVGSLFYRTFGYIMLLLFSISTIVLYSLLKAISLNIFKPKMFYLLSCTISNFLWIFLICEGGERLTLEVGNKFVISMAKLRSNVKSPEVRYEVDSFLATIATFPPVVTLNNYVSVNRRLLVTINSTMCTYLIVVLQFSQEFNDQSIFLSNNTKDSFG